jgi:hypothetical protein
MFLTGYSLGMNFFTLGLFRCLQENLGSKQPIFTNLGSLEKSWPVDGSYRIFDHGLGQWLAPDSMIILVMMGLY